MPAMEALRDAIGLDEIAAASDRIRPYIHETTVITSRLFNEAAGVTAFFKCENLQRGGAFKIRGAFNFLLQLNEDERRKGVVAFSSGNHAQALAIAAAQLKVKATIVMPHDAPRSKVESTRAYGPELVFYDRVTEDREKIAAQIAARTGATVVPPYDHRWIVAGQGTAAYELLRQVPDLDAVVVPLGGGGLFAGTLSAAKAIRPGIYVFGAEPEGAADWHESLKRGEIVSLFSSDTIADGLRTPAPGKVPFEIGRGLADGVLLVTEEQIKETVRFLLTRLKLLVEPSGVVAAAAVLNRLLRVNARRVGVVLSGGNVDLAVLARICEEAPNA